MVTAKTIDRAAILAWQNAWRTREPGADVVIGPSFVVDGEVTEVVGCRPDAPPALGLVESIAIGERQLALAEQMRARSEQIAGDMAEVDASLLVLPLIGFLPGGDPRMLGTIEAIEAPGRDFALGVLWHPEEDAGSRVVAALVSRARTYAGARSP